MLEVDKPLVVPIHKKIRFLVTSNDVNHSWWVPDLGIKRDAIPGFVHEAWARIDKPGIYRGQCAELCGMRHGFMPIVIVAMTNADFEKWVAKQKKVAPAADQAVAAPKDLTKAELMQLGKKTYLAHCSVCHKPDGKGMPPAFPSMVGGKVTTGPVSVHIQIVLNGKKGTAMQAFKDQLTTQEIAAVVTYERNSWGNDNKQKYGKDAGGLIQPVDILKEQGVKIGPPASAASKPEGEKEKPKAATPETSKPEAKKEKPKAATPEVSKPDVEKEKATPQPVQSAAMTKDQLMELGKKVYLKHCSVCHQPNGQGMPPAFPTMVGSKITTGPVAGHINIVLYGKKGTTMQAFQEQLTDKEIAAVVTYERNSWGNDDKQKYGKEAGGLIQPADVVKAKG